MKRIELDLAGPCLLEMEVHRDERGSFAELFRKNRFADLGISAHIVQFNLSRSHPGVVRGLHYQLEPPQGKLITVLSGAIWDVFVDIRPESPTFGRWMGMDLAAESGQALWLPEGFAHGFCVRGEASATLLYGTTGEYNPGGEGGIRWNDPGLGIAWPIAQPQLSSRDRRLPLWDDVRARLLIRN